MKGGTGRTCCRELKHGCKRGCKRVARACVRVCTSSAKHVSEARERSCVEPTKLRSTSSIPDVAADPSDCKCARLCLEHACNFSVGRSCMTLALVIVTQELFVCARIAPRRTSVSSPAIAHCGIYTYS
eukprot:6175301-Pleurochrysis_carterae.AAC.2